MHSRIPEERERARRAAAPLAERMARRREERARREVVRMAAGRAKKVAKLILGLLFAFLCFAFFAFFGGWTFLIGIGVMHYHGMSAGPPETLLGLGFMVCAGGCVLWLAMLEHELRGLPSGRIHLPRVTGSEDQGDSGDYLGGGTVRVGAPARFHKPRRRKYAPGSLVGVGLLVMAGGLIPLLIGVGIYFEAAKSSLTQASGVHVTANVIDVETQTYCHRGSCSDSATIDVELPRPMNGLRHSTVHVPHSVSYADFDNIAIVVDPNAPGYSELPGTPDTTYWGLIGPGIGTLIFFLLGGLLIYISIWTWFHRHSLRSMRPAPSAAAPAPAPAASASAAPASSSAAVPAAASPSAPSDSSTLSTSSPSAASSAPPTSAASLEPTAPWEPSEPES